MGNRLLRTALAVVACSTVAASAVPAHAAKWGEGSFELVERTGWISLGTPALGASGAMSGSGFQVRYVMPLGWGAYWRWTTASTSLPNTDPSKPGQGTDWRHVDLMAGFSKSILDAATANPLLARFRLRFDVGMGYSNLGTYESCTKRWWAFSQSCSSSSPGRPIEASGVALGLEARVAADLGLGPVTVGVDVGVGGFRQLLTGENSSEIPGWFAVTSAQLRLGVGLPFD